MVSQFSCLLDVKIIEFCSSITEILLFPSLLNRRQQNFPRVQPAFPVREIFQVGMKILRKEIFAREIVIGKRSLGNISPRKLNWNFDNKEMRWKIFDFPTSCELFLYRLLSKYDENDFHHFCATQTIWTVFPILSEVSTELSQCDVYSLLLTTEGRISVDVIYDVTAPEKRPFLNYFSIDFFLRLFSIRKGKQTILQLTQKPESAPITCESFAVAQIKSKVLNFIESVHILFNFLVTSIATSLRLQHKLKRITYAVNVDQSIPSLTVEVQTPIGSFARMFYEQVDN